MRSLIILTLALAGQLLFAQDLSLTVLGIPAELKENADVVVRSYDVDYTLRSPSEATNRVRRVVTLLNDKAEHERQLVVFYDDDSKVTDFSITAYDAFGQKVDRVNKGDATDRMRYDNVSFVNDVRYKLGEVACQTYPCTVVMEYAEKLKGANLMHFPEWLPQRYDVSVETSSLTVRVPAGLKLFSHVNQVEDASVEVVDEMDVYRWSVSSLPAVASESYAPQARLILPYVRVTPEEVEIEGYRANYTDWTTFSKFMADLYADRQQLTPQLRAQVREIVAPLATELEKIDALYQFMQQRMRYVGIQLGLGGFQPFPALDTEETRYGDCKALSNYLMALLAEAGIPSNPVVINWGDEHFPANDAFVTNVFNHVLLYVPSQEMFLECTSKNAPTGYLGSDRRDRKAVLVSADGGKLIDMPETDPAENGVNRRLSVVVSEDGKATYREHLRFTGSSHDIIRAADGEMGDRDELKKWLHAQDYLPDVRGKDFALDCSPEEPAAELDYATEINRYARVMGSRLFVPINSNPSVKVLVPEEGEAERHFPVAFDHAATYRDTVEIELPENFQLESSGAKETRFDHVVGNYHSKLEKTDKGLRWTRKLVLRKAQLPSTEFADFRQFLLDVRKADGQKVVVRERKTK